MGSTYLVFVRTPEGTVNNKPIYNGLDAACYEPLRRNIYSQVSERVRSLYKKDTNKTYDGELRDLRTKVLKNLTSKAYKEHSSDSHDTYYGSHRYAAEVTVNTLGTGGGDSTLKSIPFSSWLVRMYTKKNYLYIGTNTNPDAANRYGLKLEPETPRLQDFINPVAINDMLRTTLRLIPETSDVIGPANHPCVIDVLFNEQDIRASMMALWSIRYIDENPIGYSIVPWVVTMAALTSISPGLGLYYLLWTQSAPLYRCVGTRFHNNFILLNNLLAKTNTNQWVRDLNRVNFKFKDNDYNLDPWNVMGHYLNSFQTGYPKLTTIKKLVKTGRIPSEVGFKNLYDHGPDFKFNQSTEITSSLKVKEPKKTKPKVTNGQWNVMIGANHITEAFDSLTTGGVVSDNIRNELDKVCITMTGKPLSYFKL